jgi:uncharacterized protein
VTHLPGLGSAVGADQATATVARAADGRVTVTGRRGQITFGRTGWEPRRAVELEPGFTLHLEDQEPYRDCYQWRPAPRLDQVHADRFAELLHGAWAVLTARHPQHAAAIRVLLRVVVPLVPNGPGTSVSAASRHAGGSVAIALPDTAEELALLLQHEFMHMKLDNVRDLTDLHHRQSCGRFLAPWRMDPRPVGALFQGVFAHAGVTDYWRTRRHSPAATPLADLEFAYWREQNRIAVAALSESGELTPAGERFVSGLRETLAGWETEVVPATIAAKVDIMVQAQTTRWRLRNWTPGPGELPPVVRAWRAGHPPGVVDPVGTLRAETDGEPSGVPGIVGLIRESIVRADAVADGADRALLVGDRAAAVRDYAARATREPGDDDAWVGLAVAADGPAGRALRLRPDLVRGLFAQLSDGKPMVLARWLGTSL